MEKSVRRSFGLAIAALLVVVLLLLDKYQYELNEMDVLYLSINLQQIMLDGVIGKK